MGRGGGRYLANVEAEVEDAGLLIEAVALGVDDHWKALGGAWRVAQAAHLHPLLLLLSCEHTLNPWPKILNPKPLGVAHCLYDDRKDNVAVDFNSEVHIYPRSVSWTMVHLVIGSNTRVQSIMRLAPASVDLLVYVIADRSWVTMKANYEGA